MVGRQLQDQGGGRHAPEQRAVEQQASQHCHHDPAQVQAKDHQPRLAREEDRRQQHVDRQARPTAHKGHQHAGQDALALVFHGARGVDAGHRTAKTDDHRQEALALQSQSLHQAVHHEGRPRHVARIFEQPQAQIQDPQHRHEGQHPTHPRQQPANQQALYPRAAQPQPAQQRAEPTGQRAREYVIQPIHVRGWQLAGQAEQNKHHQQKKRQTQPAVRHQAVNFFRGGQPIAGAADNLLGKLADPAVTLIGDQHSRFLAGLRRHLSREAFGLLQQGGIGRFLAQRGKQRRVAFEQLERHPTRRVKRRQVGPGGDLSLQGFQGRFERRGINLVCRGVHGINGSQRRRWRRWGGPPGGVGAAPPGPVRWFAAALPGRRPG